MSLKKDMKKLKEAVERSPGWRVEDRETCWMCYSPDGESIVNIHKTPSDHRALANARSHLRRAGFNG